MGMLTWGLEQEASDARPEVGCNVFVQPHEHAPKWLKDWGLSGPISQSCLCLRNVWPSSVNVCQGDKTQADVVLVEPWDWGVQATPMQSQPGQELPSSLATELWTLPGVMQPLPQIPNNTSGAYSCRRKLSVYEWRIQLCGIHLQSQPAQKVGFWQNHRGYLTLKYKIQVGLWNK